MKKFFAQSNSNRGFSLIGFMIVVAIIGIISGIAIPMTLHAVKRTQRTSLIKDGRVLFEAFEMYHVKHDEFPPCCSPPDEAFKRDTLQPLTREELVPSGGGILGKLQNNEITVYDSPDLPTTNHDFYAVMTHRSDPSIQVLICDTDQYPGHLGENLYGIYLIRPTELVHVR